MVRNSFITQEGIRENRNKYVEFEYLIFLLGTKITFVDYPRLQTCHHSIYKIRFVEQAKYRSLKLSDFITL